MKKWNYTLGVDVSKLTLDVFCVEADAHIKIDNNATGFKQFIKWAKLHKIDLKSAIVALEYTGGYEYRFIQFCAAKLIPFVRIPGLEIKKSQGITRGKNDKIDAKRIAVYADEKHKKISPSKPLNMAMLAIRDLLTYRKRIVRENAGYKATLKERLHMYPELKLDPIVKDLQKRITYNEKSVATLEAQLDGLIAQDPQIQTNFKLLTSIKGIGKINAIMTIAFTENFTCFTNARAYAVYVGVVPFDNSSGTSLKGRKQVSKLANRGLKAELNQAARSAIVWNQDMKEYAERLKPFKVYPLILNNVKFKLILRMFAVIKKQENYVDKIKNVA